MMRRLPLFLCSAARRLLPAARRSWADAMFAELPHADDERAALRFASGCVVAALGERLRDADTQIRAGLWSIALVTAFDAAARLACAARGVSVLLGAPDGMRDALLRHGADPALAARYDVARPIVAGCFLALGGAQFATAWFLSLGRMRPFFIMGAIALSIAGLAVAVQLSVVWDVAGVPSEFHSALVQAVAVPALLIWARRRRSGLREV